MRAHLAATFTLLLLLGACGSQGAVTQRTTASPKAPQPPRTTTRSAHHAPPSHRPSTTLPYSTASNDVVQRQPPAGTCHATGTGLYERPDPSCTPGALDPAVTQATIDKTICVPGWTDSVRPPENITEPEKAASMAAYGDTGSMGDYEYDHFVPLELGGATNDPRNLWPEPGASPNPKDAVEDWLRQRVCDRQMSLAQAQRVIVRNWVSLAARIGAPQRPPTGGHASGHCNLTASYNSTYHDYDVYVESNQPDQTVTVTDAAGESKTWHTDSTGYADVYFHASSDALGEAITAHVGTATCEGRL